MCSCSASTSAVAFGAYDPLAASPTDATGSVTVSCSGVIALAGSYTITLATGTSGTYTERQLANGSNRLGYNLYTSAARTIVWGDGSGGSATQGDTLSGILLSENKTFTVYGRLRARQNVPAGVYADAIVVTVSF